MVTKNKGFGTQKTKVKKAFVFKNKDKNNKIFIIPKYAQVLRKASKQFRKKSSKKLRDDLLIDVDIYQLLESQAPWKYAYGLSGEKRKINAPAALLKPAKEPKTFKKPAIATLDIESISLKVDEISTEKYQFYTDSETRSEFGDNFKETESYMFSEKGKIIQVPIALGISYPIALRYSEDFCSNNLTTKIFKIENLTTSPDQIIDQSLEMMKKVFLFMYQLRKVHFKDYTSLFFYAHNSGRYDSPIILNNYLKLNIRKLCKTNISAIRKNSSIIALKLGKGIEIRDSYQLLQESLDSLSEKILNKNKVVIPTNIFTLESFKPSNPNFINPKLFDEYLTQDCVLLYELLEQLQNFVGNNFNMKFYQKLTISSLTQYVFFRNFYKPIYNLTKKKWNRSLFSLNFKQEEFVRKAFTGGRTEVRKPYMENGFAWDLNSAYVYSMSNLDMPSNRPKGIYEVQDSFGFFLYELDNFFGFAEATVYSPCDSNIMPVLPYRTKNKRLIFPHGCFTGHFFSEELKLAKKMGYIVLVKKTIQFERSNKLFHKYLELLLGLRANFKKGHPFNFFAKLFGNGLFGRFGLRIKQNKPVVTFTEKQFNKLLEKQMVVDTQVIKTVDNKEIRISKTVPFAKEKEVTPDEIQYTAAQSRKFVCPHVSAAVASYTRILLYKGMMDMGPQHVCYVDTDSMYSSSQNPPAKVSPTKAGYWKLEHKIKRAFFVAQKTYVCYTDEPDKEEEKVITKFKGIPKSYLDYIPPQFFEKVILNKESNFKIEGDLDKNLSGPQADKVTGLMRVIPKTYSFNSTTLNSYINKVYNEKGEWIDCLPVTYVGEKLSKLEDYLQHYVLIQYQLDTYKEKSTPEEYWNVRNQYIELVNEEERLKRLKESFSLNVKANRYDGRKDKFVKTTEKEIIIQYSLSVAKFDTLQALKEKQSLGEELSREEKKVLRSLNVLADNFMTINNCSYDEIETLLKEQEEQENLNYQNKIKNLYKKNTQK